MKRRFNFILLMVFVLLSFSSVTAGADSVHIDFYELFEEHGSIILLIDAKTGNIEHANNAAAKFYGYTIEQLEAMKIFQINALPPEAIEARMKESLNKKQNYYEIEQLLSSGEKRTVEVYSCPHVHGNKKIIFANIYDITEKVALRNKTKFYNVLFFIILISIILLIGVFTFLSERKNKKLRDLLDVNNKVTSLLSYMSYHDELTGLYNRRFFEEQLLVLNVEKNLPISVAVCDMNNLKLANDTFGHVAGDKLLIELSNVLQELSRPEDIVARVGGDEFTLLLPKTTLEEAERLASEIKAEFSKIKVKGINGSVSIGCNTKQNPGEDILLTLKNAESKMYTTKIRDRIKLSSSPSLT